MKIAIVDDNEDDRKRLQEEITKICDNKSRKDFEITEFFSGEDFINLIEKNENKKYFDIVFLDIYMNGITGIETAKKLRETDNQSKIIFITTSNEFASESYEVKAYDYLIKPFSKERILKTMERISEDEKNRPGKAAVQGLPGNRHGHDAHRKILKHVYKNIRNLFNALKE